jgi:hypothetical protein
MRIVTVAMARAGGTSVRDRKANPGGRLTDQKPLEFTRTPQILAVRVNSGWTLAYVPGKVKAQEHKNRHRCDLASQSRNHDVDPSLQCIRCTCCCRHRTTNSLKKKRDEVAKHERKSDCSSCERHEICAEDWDDSRKTQVDRRREECRTDGGTDEVDCKGVLVEYIEVKLDPSDVSHDFESQSTEHSS